MSVRGGYVGLAALTMVALSSRFAYAGPESAFASSGNNVFYTADVNNNPISATDSISDSSASGVVVVQAPLTQSGPASATGQAAAELSQNGFLLFVDSQGSAPIGTLSAASNTSTASITIDRIFSGPANIPGNLGFTVNAHALPQPDSPWFFPGNYYTQALGFSIEILVNNQQIFSTNYDTGINPSNDPDLLLNFNVPLNLNPGDHLYIHASEQASAGVDAYHISSLTPGARGTAHVDPPSLEFTFSAQDTTAQLLSDTGNAAIDAAALVPEPASLAIFGVPIMLIAANRRRREQPKTGIDEVW